MKLLFDSTGWQELGEGSPELKDKFTRSLVDILRAENLVVLCGLGTSMCVKNGGGSSLAPSMDNLWDAVKQTTATAFDDAITKVGYAGAEKNIEKLLSRCQLAEALQHDEALSTFIRNAEAEIVRRCGFVTPGVSLAVHEMFLRKVGRRSTRQPRMKLFTTNYDLCFETAASGAGFVVVDGFSHTNPQTFDGGNFAFDFVRRSPDRDTPDYIPNVFHLYKLHGSLDWSRNDERILRQAKPDRPLIIYPRHEKFELSYEQPFLEMMSRFQMSLRQPNTGVLIIGFGFNDNHLVQPLLSAVRGNVGMKALVVSRSLESHQPAPIQALDALIRGGDQRLGFCASTFEELVPLIPDLVAQTDEEMHQRRLNARGDQRRG